MQGIAGKRAGNTIVNFNKIGRNTKDIELDNTDLTSSDVTFGATTSLNVSIHEDSDLNRYLECIGTLNVTVARSTLFRFKINNTEIKSNVGLFWNGRISISDTGDQVYTLVYDKDDSTYPNEIAIDGPASASTDFYINFRLPLASVPSWVSESDWESADIDAYIPPASDTEKGTLSYYKSSSDTYEFQMNNSSNSSGSITVRHTRIGNVVTLTIQGDVKATGDTIDTNLTSTTKIPSEFRPTTVNQFSAYTAQSGGVLLAPPGMCRVTSAGFIQLFRDGTQVAAWNTTNCGSYQGITVSYCIA